MIIFLNISIGYVWYGSKNRYKNFLMCNFSYEVNL